MWLTEVLRYEQRYGKSCLNSPGLAGKAQSLLSGISNKLSVKPQQCACSHRADPGYVGIVSPHLICGLSLGFGWDLLFFFSIELQNVAIPC